jgi:hypothetical protein
MENNIILIGLIMNGIVSYVISSFVKNREISKVTVFWLSFLFTPIVGMFAAMMSPEVKGETKEVTKDGDNEDNVTNSIGLVAIIIIFTWIISLTIK